MAAPTAFPNAFPQQPCEQKRKQRRLPLLRTQIAGCCPGLSGAIREILRDRNPLAGLADRQNPGRMDVSCFAFFVEIF